MPKNLNSLQLVTDPEHWAVKQEELHQQQMRLYEEKFDNNKIMYFHDLWEYIERRLADPNGATIITHPQDDFQHPSIPSVPSVQPQMYVRQANEND